MSEKLKNIFEPSEKVQKMYEAIAAFVPQKIPCHLNSVREIYQNKKDKIRVTDSNLTKFLGKERYSQEEKNDTAIKMKGGSWNIDR